MSRCPTINFQFSIMSKWLAEHISTKVSFKITGGDRHVYIHIGWPWIWNQCFCLGIWNDDLTKLILLPSFQLATRLNSQNTYESDFINELWYINLFMNIGISYWHNWTFDLTYMLILLYFCSLQDYWHRSTCNPLVHNSWGEMKRVEKRVFKLPKMRKKN